MQSTVASTGRCPSLRPSLDKQPEHRESGQRLRGRQPWLTGLVWLWLVVALLGALLALPGHAQVPGQTTSGTALSVDDLIGLRDSVTGSATLSDTERSSLLKTYDQSIADLRALQQVQEQNHTLEQTLLHANERLNQLATLRKKPAAIRGLAEFDPMTLEQLEAEKLEIEQNLNQAQQSYQAAQTRLSRLLGAAQSLSNLVTDRKTALERIAIELSSLPESSTAPAVVARRQSLLARQRLYQAEIDYNSRILANQTLLSSLTQAERDHANAQISRWQSEMITLANLILERRQEVARQAREQASALQTSAAELPAGISSLAQQNTTLRVELEKILQAEQSMDLQLKEVDSLRAALREDFDRIRQRVAIVGQNASISDILRSRRSELPRLSGLYQLRQERDDEIADATHRQLQIDDEIRLLEQQVQGFKLTIDQQTQSLTGFERRQLQTQAQAVLDAYRNTLTELQNTRSRHISRLVSLDVAQSDLEKLIHDYATYIDQQLFWMPSTSALRIASFPSDQWQPWLSRQDSLAQITSDWKQYVMDYPVRCLASLLLVGLLWARRRWARRELVMWSQQVRKVSTDTIALTVKAVGAHLIRILPLPLLLLLIGEVTRSFPDAVAISLAGGLKSTAMLLFTLGMVNEFASPTGVGASHFGWPRTVCSQLREQLRWFIPFGAVLSFIVGAYTQSSPPQTVQTLGSLAFIILLAGWFYITTKLFGSDSCLRSVLKEDFPKTWINQLHFIWYPFLLLIPVVLCVLSLADYHYTAVQLETRVQMTIWFLISLYMLVEFVLRWLYVTARRLKQAERHRKLQRERSAAHLTSADDGDGDQNVIAPTLLETNFDSLSEQSKRLVHTGFVFAVLFGTWSIWVDLVPALGVLDGNGLGYSGGQAGPSDLTGIMSVATVDILGGLFIIVLTALAARNIPGLLEIIFLQRLPLDNGARYALTALTQYLIVGIGLFLAFRTMGVEWSKLQWLIAALGVGLGFGLQEIVANFVSGIILLFERPIRVGDVVTINDTTGVVTRIQIRATTITNYDRQELVVPNKTFITGQLINWTLSDRLNRILIPVGVAYDTDIDQAMELMQQAAQEIPEVLNDPAPLVSFESFESNALMLYLRAYLGNLDNRLTIISRLHKSILLKFRAAGIEIAFAQRDVHVDFKHPIDVHLRGSLDTKPVNNERPI